MKFLPATFDRRIAEFEAAKRQLEHDIVSQENLKKTARTRTEYERLCTGIRGLRSTRLRVMKRIENLLRGK